MSESLHIGVFCGADDKMSQNLKDFAFELGVALCNGGYKLVTGASCTGLMNAVANGFASYNNVKGVIPSIFKEYNVHHPKIPEQNLTWTESVYERLKTFQEMCDAMIVLPGGFGTLHELMDFMVSKQWGIGKKKVVLLNVDRFWDSLLMQFERMVEKNALAQKHLDLLTVVTTVGGCIEAIQVDESPHEGLGDRFWERQEKIR